MFNINIRSRSEELNYIHLLTLKIFNINLRSRSEELNYLHGCSQYVQYQPTFKICGTNLYTSAYPQYIHSQHTFGSDVLNYLLGFPSIFNINLRSRSEEQNYLHGCSQYVQYQPTFKIWGTKLYTRLLSVCSISTYVQDLRNKSIHLCLPSVYSFSAYVWDLMY